MFVISIWNIQIIIDVLLSCNKAGCVIRINILFNKRGTNSYYDSGVNDSKRRYILRIRLGAYGGSWVGGGAYLYDADTNTLLASVGCKESDLINGNVYGFTFALQPSNHDGNTQETSGEW